MGHADSFSLSTQFRRSPCQLHRPASAASDTNMASVCLPLRPQVIRRNSCNCGVMALLTIWIHRPYIIQRVTFVSEGSTAAFSHKQVVSAATSCDSCGARVTIKFYFNLLCSLSFPLHVSVLFSSSLLIAFYIFFLFWFHFSVCYRTWWSDFSGVPFFKYRPGDQQIFSVPPCKYQDSSVPAFLLILFASSSFVFSSFTFSLPIWIHI